jgi:25S rRNA (cytosine2278-C5)-methyltransferase
MARNAQLLLDIASGILFSNATRPSTGLKNLLYDANIGAGQRTMLMALVNGAHKERDQLFACAEEEGFLMALPSHLRSETDQSPQLFDIQVALYECLLGSRRVRGTSELVDFVKTRKKSLQMTLTARRKRGATNSYVPRIRMPRYVRVNHLRLSMSDAIAYMESVGYTQVDPASVSGTNNYTSVAPSTFLVDPLIPSLLILPPLTSFHGDPLVEAGALALQDRSSCLTALALNPPSNAHVIDTCSAPGNKTLHIASIMRGKGTITAFERSENRFRTLRRRIELQGAGNFCTPIMKDFMTVNTDEDFPDATHILIDPSCSGSGLVLTYSLGETPSFEEAEHMIAEESIATLAREQLALILHAMSIPSARVVAYSTCSVHRAENEDVVLAALAARKDWKLAQACPQWPHRGLDLLEFEEIRAKVCRASCEKDGTNGFFVARFERTFSSGEDTLYEKKMKSSEGGDDSHSKKKSRKEKRKCDSDDAPPKKQSKNQSKNRRKNDDDVAPLKVRSKKHKKARECNEDAPQTKV